MNCVFYFDFVMRVFECNLLYFVGILFDYKGCGGGDRFGGSVGIYVSSFVSWCGKRSIILRISG